MPEPVNPLLPAWYDVAWSAMVVVILVLLVVCLISIARTAKSLSSFQSLAWTLVAIFVPIVGPLAWLFIGRRSLAEPRDARKTSATS
ncbi:PLD nuclease N-terminal domain-containing protein [Microbacterium murale]|uniref:PLD nuclease N-terminal domain-containing protein n=1 Tax=Microbacterium murale TaxID=1081040 RepID=UPI0016635B85|nr:PLD nuclease N-terminal domain-containing protein [Microbacterium murale]